MTAELEYSYIGNTFNTRISSGLMTRAVRVKGAVKEKLGRVFYNNVKMTTPNVEPVVQVEEKKASTLDTLAVLTDENLDALSSKLNAVIEQKKVPYTVRRVVLFTKALVNKIEAVSDKWFKAKEETTMPSVELPKIDENVEAKTTELPKEEPVIPTIELPKMDEDVETKAETDLSNEEETPQVELPKIETHVEEDSQVELPKVDIANHLGGEVIPGTWDDEVSKEELKQEEPATEFVPEPVSVAEIPKEDFVPEPREVSNEMPEKEEVAEKTEEKEVTQQSVEDKINELLHRARETRREQKVEKDDEDSKSESSQSDIVYRVSRLKQENEESKRKIGSMTRENEELKEKYDTMKKNYDDSMALVRGITKEHKRLSSDYDYLKGNYENAKRTIEDMKTKHSEEISALKREQAKQIKEIQEANERKISAIYSTISEVLGEAPLQEETQEIRKAA